MLGLSPEEAQRLQEQYGSNAGVATQSPTNSSSNWFTDLLDDGGDLLGGAWDWLTGTNTGTAVGSVGGGLLAAYLANQQDASAPSGYQGGIPDYTYNRQQIQRPVDPNRRPGSGGRRYFTDGAYSDGGEGGTPSSGGIPNVNDPSTAGGIATIPSRTQPAQEPEPQNQLAKGGIASVADQGRYLRGKTNGMADKIQTSIEGKDPAALSHGEFVIPADVVAFLGGGNSEAGAEKLQQMMASVRKDATGSDKQIKQVDPNKTLNGMR